MNVLSVDGVKKSFRSGMSLAKREVLRGVSLHARPAEVLGFLGPNGAGKTTTIKIVLGLIRADVGSVRIYDRPAGSSEAAARTGYLPETPYFHPHLSLDECLRFCGRLSGLGGERLARRIEAALATVDLAAHRARRLREFSKGMLQRAGLAQAILHEPDLLVLDEPFSGLDPVGRKLVRDVLVGLKAKGATIVFSSHILPDMEALCDRACIIRDGVIARTLGLDELMRLGEGKIEITARGVRPGTIAALHAELESVAERGEETFLVVREQRFVRPVIAHLYEHGADVLEVSNERRSLEDIFMQEIARPARPAGGDAARARTERKGDPAVFAGSSRRRQ